MALNNVVIMGRITKDLELKRTQSGTAVVSFAIACDRDFKGQNGEKETDFISVTAWRNTAEYIAKYFSKGRMIVIAGRLQTRKWQDKNGNNRMETEVIADNVYFGDSKPSNGGQTQQARNNTYGAKQPYNQPQNAPMQPQQQPQQMNGFFGLNGEEEPGNLPF